MQSIIENIRENFVDLLQLQNRVDLLFICFVILKWMSFFTQLIADLGFSVARPHLPWICTIFVASRYIRAVWSEWHFFYSSSQNIMYWYSLGCIPYIQSIPNRYVKYFGGSQSPLYGRVTKKYDIYRNNNKKNLDTLAKVRLLVKKIFFYEVNFFYSLIKLNFSLI